MGYNISKEGKKFADRIAKLGKDKALVPFYYNPPLQKPVMWLSVFCLIATVPAFIFLPWWAGVLCFVGFIGFYFIHDFFIQDDKALLRIYGPVGRARYIVEKGFRDKILQYFIETNTDGRPIPRIVRDYIYQKAKDVKAYTSFGTELDINDEENVTYARILHLNFPGTIAQPSYEVVVGAHHKHIQPFVIKNVINISAMSYGSLNYKAAECLSFGAKDVCYVNTGEGGFGPHGIAGNDVVFQIGTGKFGCGDHATLPDGKPTRVLNRQLLKELVTQNPNIKMIQLKISQGAKPGVGGMLPAEKVTPEIAAVRKVEPYKAVISPPQHAELIAATPKEAILKLIDFIKEIRNLTLLPVGIKFCIGRLEEVDMLVEAMKATGDGPDAIQLDGADGGTGAGPNLFVNYVGFGGAVESVAYLDKKLKEAGIRDRVVIGASGRLFTPVHAALAFAYGADVIDTARGAMLSLGCIQALKCHTGDCPTGITTSKPWRVHGIVLNEKATRVHNYFSGYHKDMMELTRVMGFSDPRDITPEAVRMLSYEKDFAKHFEEDPFGLFMPTPQKLIEN